MKRENPLPPSSSPSSEPLHQEQDNNVPVEDAMPSSSELPPYLQEILDRKPSSQIASQFAHVYI